jgi:hypothetical protein
MPACPRPADTPNPPAGTEQSGFLSIVIVVVIVRFQRLSRVVVVVGFQAVGRVVVNVVVPATGMLVGVRVLVDVLVGMAVGMLVGMHLAVMAVLVLVGVDVFMTVQMFVFVTSTHDIHLHPPAPFTIAPYAGLIPLTIPRRGLFSMPAPTKTRMRYNKITRDPPKAMF